MLGLARLGPARIAGELLSRPLGEWDLVLDAGFHRFLPLANALPAVAFTALFFQSKRLRPLVGGLALGSAAFMGQLALSGDVASIGGPVLQKIWMAVNAAVCLWIARMSLDRKS
jgi:serine protease